MVKGTRAKPPTFEGNPNVVVTSSGSGASASVSIDVAEKLPNGALVFDCEQGGDEWRMLRLGIPSASNFAKIMAKSVDRIGRERLLRDLAGELMTGKPAENFKNKAMERGTQSEPFIREMYREQAGFGEVVRQVGWIRNGKFGCSPDSLVGKNGGLEVKSMNAAGIIELIQNGSKPPTEHKAQIQGNLMITGRDWWDLAIGCEHSPGYDGIQLLKWRFVPDLVYQAELKNELDIFELDLRRLVEQLKPRK